MTFIKRCTGPGVTEAVNMVSADLGIVRYDPKRGAYAYLFGDNFSERYLKGEWQSPSIVMYDKDHNLLGIPAGGSQIISSGNRRQCIPYEHGNNEFTTILPCDFINIDGRWVMAAMVTRGLGNELRTVFWESDDLVTWRKTDPYVRLDHPGHPGNVMLTFDRRGDWVHIFGTGGLRRDRGVWMWRCDADTFPHGLWEPYGFNGVEGWAYGHANETSQVLPGRYGELSFRFVQGNPVLSFFDVDRYCCSAVTVADVTHDWTKGNRVDYAWGQQFPQLYGGYITDDSRLGERDGMKFTVSQWNTQSNDPYHVVAFADTLQAMGPLIEVPPTPEPETPEPEEPPVDPTQPTDPQGTYELLLRELAASGSTEILTPDGRKLTLREAVGEIYDQTCSLHSLKGQPVDPRTATPQLDQILSSRAEQLFTQALVVAIADKFGIDAEKIYADVKASIG